MKAPQLLNILMNAQSVLILAMMPSLTPRSVLNLTEFMDLMLDKVSIAILFFLIIFTFLSAIKSILKPEAS